METDRQDFRIDDHPIDTVSESAERRIVGMVVNEYEATRLYYSPRIEIGRDVWRKIMGILFGDAALAEMDAEKKIPIEIAEGWPKYLAVMGMASVSQKSGVVIANYPSNAAVPEMVNTALNAIKDEENVKAMQLASFGDGAVTGFPQFIWVDKPQNYLDGQHLMIDRGAWDSTLPDVNFQRVDGKDLGVVFRVMYAKKESILALYPNRKKQIQDAFKSLPDTSNASDYGTTVEERNTIFGAIEAAAGETSETGRVHLIERHCMIRRAVEVYWSEDDEKWTSLSPDWDEARREEWKAANPDKRPMMVDAPVHWVTTITLTGQLLENRPHWFQEGRFNCEMFVPHMADGKPVGIFEFATNNWMLSAIAKTEEVHSLRLNNGNPVIYQKGALTKPEQLAYEISSPRGAIEVRQGVNVNNVIKTLDSKRDNVPWRELHMEAAETNDRLTVDRNVEGGAQSSQEAAKVFGARVAQVKNKYAMALDNFNRFNLRLDSLIVRCWQILTDSHTSLQWVDPESGAMQEAEFNVPQDYDLFTGEPKNVTNRLDLCKYDVVMAESDNSVSGRAAELEQFANIMQAVISTPPEHWGSVLSQVPNKIAKSIGQSIKAKEQAAAENPPQNLPKVSVSLPLDKLMNNPPAMQAAQQLMGLQPPMAPSGSEAPQQELPPAPSGEPANGPINPEQEMR